MADDRPLESLTLRIFDRVEISALELAIKINAKKNEVAPPPSDAFARLVRVHPVLLIALNGGTQWQMRMSDKREQEPINPQAYPLKPEDLAVAEKLLALPYIEAWIECMREAWVGNADKPCIEHLAKLASQEPPEVRKILLADVGARLTNLSLQNREWNELLLAKTVPPAINAALDQYQALEYDKIRTAVAYGGHSSGVKGSDAVGIIFVSFDGHDALLGSDANGFWGDFRISIDEASGPAASKYSMPGLGLYGWYLKEQGKIEPVPRPEADKGLSAATWVLGPSQHIIITGDIDPEMIKEFENFDVKSDRAWDMLLKAAGRKDINVFLSRPGLPELGLMTIDDAARRDAMGPGFEGTLPERPR